MHANPTRAAATYTQVQVDSRSPLELVVMLYDGALASLQQAAEAIRRRDLFDKSRTVSRALAIVSQLQNTLNMEEGREVADQLDRLYWYVIERITAANVNSDAAAIDEAARLLRTLRDAWAELASREHAVAP
jgi:flagellar protein FliS